MIPQHIITTSPVLQELEPTNQTCKFLASVSYPVLQMSPDTIRENLYKLENYGAPVSILSTTTFRADDTDETLQLYKLAEYLLLPDNILQHLAYECTKAYILTDTWTSIGESSSSLKKYIRHLWAAFIDFIELFTEYIAAPPIEYRYGGWGDGLEIACYNAPYSFTAIRDPFSPHIIDIVYNIRADEIRIQNEYGFIEPCTPSYNLYDIIYAIIIHTTNGTCKMTLYDMTYDLMKYGVLHGKRSSLYTIAEKRRKYVKQQTELGHQLNCDCDICIKTHYPSCICHMCYYG